MSRAKSLTLVLVLAGTLASQACGGSPTNDPGSRPRALGGELVPGGDPLKARAADEPPPSPGTDPPTVPSIPPDAEPTSPPPSEETASPSPASETVAPPDSALPPSPPPDAQLSLLQMNLMLRKHLVATGAVVAHPACIEAGATVKIKRFNTGSATWETIATAEASTEFGTYRARLPDLPGKYRVRVATYPAGFVLCAAGGSSVQKHVH